MKKIISSIIKYDRSHFSKGRNPNRFICRPKPRSYSAVARQDARYGLSQVGAVHDENVPVVRPVPWASLYASVPSYRRTAKYCSDTSGCGCTRRPVRVVESRLPPKREPQFDQSGRWQDQYRICTHPHCRFRGRVRAFTQEVSPVLLNRMKYLVLGPGAMGYFGMLGVVKSLEDKLEDVEGISGSSAGALLGLFIASGKTIDDIFEISMDTDLNELVKYNIKNFLTSYGLVSHDSIKQKLIEICGGDVQFKDLEKDLYVATYNTNRGNTEYFSKHTHPEMSAIDAVCMSISVPFLFSSFKYNDMLYVDGGTSETVPVPPFFGKRNDDVLIVKLSLKPVVTDDISNVREYISCIVRSALGNRVDYSGMYPTLEINLDEFNLFDFNMSQDDKLKMYMKGVFLCSDNIKNGSV